MKYSKAQLNAISRAKAERNQREALTELEAIGVDFRRWCEMFNYKASPTRLASAIRWNEPKTLSHLDLYRKETSCIRQLILADIQKEKEANK